MNASRVVRAVLLSLLLGPAAAQAVPSFARQSGMTCSACHTIFPELTPFGRQFKAGGYTLTSTPQLKEGGSAPQPRVALELPSTMPLGAMVVVGFTHTLAPQQVGPADAPPAQNDDLSLPQQFSVFFAGKIAPELGAFVQLTYEGPEGTLGFDNTDLRFAHKLELAGAPLILGATLNNGPTVTDLWNSTPAWGQPFISSASAPTPAASTLLEGRLAQAVAGLGIYGFWNELLYAELDVYRSAPLGIHLPLDSSTGATDVIQTVMPYWRLAVEKGLGNNNLSVGTFGLHGVLLPGGAFTDLGSGSPEPATHPLTPPGDAYTDLAVDAQFQHLGARHIVTGTVAYIHEGRTLTASNAFGNADTIDNELHSFKASASYLFDRLVGGRVTFSTLRGTADAALSGDRGPRSTTLGGEVFTTPWQNVKLGVQYLAYLDFDGATRSQASANDTLYVYLWLAY